MLCSSWTKDMRCIVIATHHVRYGVHLIAINIKTEVATWTIISPFCVLYSKPISFVCEPDLCGSWPKFKFLSFLWCCLLNAKIIQLNSFRLMVLDLKRFAFCWYKKIKSSHEANANGWSPTAPWNECDSHVIRWRYANKVGSSKQ